MYRERLSRTTLQMPLQMQSCLNSRRFIPTKPSYLKRNDDFLTTHLIFSDFIAINHEGGTMTLKVFHRRRSLIVSATVFILLFFLWTLIQIQLTVPQDIHSHMEFIESKPQSVLMKPMLAAERDQYSNELMAKSAAFEDNKHLLDSYRAEIAQLKQDIDKLKSNLEKCTPLTQAIQKGSETVKHGSGAVANEYEVNPFSHFSFTRIYPAHLGLGKRVAEKPYGAKRKEIIQVISESLKVLSKFNRSLDDFLEGIYTVDPLVGTQYHLYFKTAKKSMNFYHKVTILRPFVPVKIVANEIVSTQRETINIILPISEPRTASLKIFLENLRHVQEISTASHNHASRLKLFLIYYGQLSAVAPLLNAFQKSSSQQSSASGVNSHIKIQVIHASNSSQDFSRAKALQLGAEICCDIHSLLFFCDVDVHFTIKYLERCRLNASKGKKIYYPILFSLYNPRYSLLTLDNATYHGNVLTNFISPEAGFWRDFGYGMTCQYKSDFLAVGGFNDYLSNSMETNDVDQPEPPHAFATVADGIGAINVQNYVQFSSKSRPFQVSSAGTGNKKSSSAKIQHIGWGGEDVLLYRKHLQHPNVTVIRAIDPGLFHIWHEKDCHNLSGEQYSSCLSSRALNEASHSQLARALAAAQIQLHYRASN